jgi:hypothetical protein
MGKYLGIYLLTILVIVAVYSAGCTKNEEETGGISPEASFEELKSIISSSPDPALREKGVIGLTQISYEANQSGEAIGFLKNVAEQDTDENVRRSAVASIGLLRSEYPLPLQSEMQISIPDPVKTNTNITIFVDLTSKTDQKSVQIGIPHLDSTIELLTPRVLKRDLVAGQPVTVTFVIIIHTDGEYVIPVLYIRDIDRYEAERVQKRIFLTVHSSNGSYEIL